jgi:hypothetical protein
MVEIQWRGNHYGAMAQLVARNLSMIFCSAWLRSRVRLLMAPFLPFPLLSVVSLCVHTKNRPYGFCCQSHKLPRRSLASCLRRSLPLPEDFHRQHDRASLCMVVWAKASILSPCESERVFVALVVRQLAYRSVGKIRINR